MSVEDLFLTSNILDEFLAENPETSYLLKHILMKINKTLSEKLKNNENDKNFKVQNEKQQQLLEPHKSETDEIFDKKASLTNNKQNGVYKHKLKMYKNFLNNSKNTHNTRKQIQQEIRDKIKLQEQDINFTLNDIVGSRSEQFNEIIKLKGLTPEQVKLIKDIRRRGKNKLAAQVCRKRKLESIDSLNEDVKNLTENLALQETQNNKIRTEMLETLHKFDELYQHLILNLSGEIKNQHIVLELQQTSEEIRDLKDSVFSSTGKSVENEIYSFENYQLQNEQSDSEESGSSFDDEIEFEEDNESVSLMSGPSTSSQSSSNTNHRYVKHHFFIENLIGISD